MFDRLLKFVPVSPWAELSWWEHVIPIRSKDTKGMLRLRVPPSFFLSFFLFYFIFYFLFYFSLCV